MHSIGSPSGVAPENQYVPPSLPDESLPLKTDESFQDEATNPDSSFARSDLDISALEEELNVHEVGMVLLLDFFASNSLSILVYTR